MDGVFLFLFAFALRGDLASGGLLLLASVELVLIDFGMCGIRSAVSL